MRKYILFKDGQRAELSPVIYQEFLALDLWCGGSDTAFDAWKRKNGFVEALDYRQEALKEAVFIVTEEPLPTLLFNFGWEDDDWLTLEECYKIQGRSKAVYNPVTALYLIKYEDWEREV